MASRPLGTSSDPAAIHVLIQDGAGFHLPDGHARLPENVRVLTLPAYSPELNPVEKRPPQPISYYIVTDPDNTWGDGFIFNPNGSSENRQTAAVDAHYGMMKTLDYYSEHGHRF